MWANRWIWNLRSTYLSLFYAFSAISSFNFVGYTTLRDELIGIQVQSLWRILRQYFNSNLEVSRQPRKGVNIVHLGPIFESDTNKKYEWKSLIFFFFFWKCYVLNIFAYNLNCLLCEEILLVFKFIFSPTLLIFNFQWLSRRQIPSYV